jgi:hypothetical protein
MSIDPGLKFEYFMQFDVPYKLNLSPSKQAAMRMKFSRFADTTRPLTKKAPEEFQRFIKEIEEIFDSIENWRAPKGTYVYFETQRNEQGTSEIVRYPNGKPQYRLYEKPPQMYDDTINQ